MIYLLFIIIMKFIHVINNDVDKFVKDVNELAKGFIVIKKVE